MNRETVTRLRRIATQHLESLRRAGLTSLPRSKPGDNVPTPDAEITTGAASLTPASPSLFPNMNESDSGTKPVSDHPPCPLTLSERREKLELLESRVASCVRCQELAETRNKTAFGVGDPEAKIMFVGEAPGADEDRQGEPFVGKAGQLLNRIIAACEMTREEIYICNILKCRPPGNRNPAPEEASNCREYLDAQIAVVDPDYIVCWGSVAARNLLDVTESIGRMRGKFFKLGRAKVLCTYHPSYLLRNPAAKKDVWADMKFLMRDMGIELD